MAELGDATVAGITDDIARRANLLSVQLRVSRLYEALKAAHKRTPPEYAAVACRIAAAASQCRDAATRTCEPALMQAGIRAALTTLRRDEKAAGPAHPRLSVIPGGVAGSRFETRVCAPAPRRGRLLATGAGPGCSPRRQRRSRPSEGHTGGRRSLPRW